MLGKPSHQYLSIILLTTLVIASQAGHAQPAQPTEEYISTNDGLRLYYAVEGSGDDTVVVLHGGPGYSMAYLRPHLSRLAEQRTVIYYDQRGSGRSTVTDEPSSINMARHIEDLETVREFFGLERLALLGHSWGAGLAAQYAARYPDRVSELLLVAPIPPRSLPYTEEYSSALTARMDEPARRELADLRAARIDAADPVAACRAYISLLLPAFFANPERTSAFRGDFCSDPPEAVDNQLRVRALTLEPLGDWDWRPELRDLEPDTLVVQGREDPMPLESAREWTVNVRDAQLLVIEDSGHFPFVEQPDNFFAAADEFLNGQWPAGARPVVPLFSIEQEFEFTLSAPIRTLVRRMSRRPEVDGTVSYRDTNGTTVELYAEVTTRGVSRLELCRFPPLRLNFRRSEVPGTLFAGQNRIKIGTRCMENDRYEQYMLLEYLIYRIYEQVTEFSFNVRLATVNYVDTEREDRADLAPAYFIEHIDGLADRVGMRAIEEMESRTVPEFDPEQLAIYSLFQYMIGSTDWSFIRSADDRECCHNTDILGPREGATGLLVPVPYDFDQAGLINTPYALPAEGLRIRSVTDRLYRGVCSTNDYLDDAIERFNAARDRIEALFELDRLNDDSKRDALEYLARSYEIINDPEELQSEIIDRCRG
jgi:pimeloyl-ACP methyl ester carboxylesterase